MMKHVMEHEQQNQVTEAYFLTYTRHNPCGNSACQHIRDIMHYHCTWVSFDYYNLNDMDP